ncbi:MAG: DedA family protein [Crocinitomicaceae bacterium]|nr:DedA family protein [Crocinitomicaceae bacterium]
MVFSAGYIGLLISSFLSATILPFSSEGVLMLLLKSGFNPTLCLLFATIGNSLGGLTNYTIGYFGNPLWLKKIGISEVKIRSFELKIQKYGVWLAFFSWIPFIGDPLSIALGFFKTGFWKFTFLMILGKFIRYFFICYWFF